MRRMRKTICDIARQFLQDGEVSDDEIRVLQEWLSTIEPPPDKATLFGLKRAIVDYCAGELDKGRLQMSAAQAVRETARIGDILLAYPDARREESPQGATREASVYFGTPWNEDILWQKVQAELEKARTSLDIAAYTLTFNPMRDVLLAKAQKGLRIRLLVEDSALCHTGDDALTLAGKKNIEVRTDGPGQLMHHKFIVIDRATVINGSMNFTRSAMSANYENIAIFESPQVADLFVGEFESLWQANHMFPLHAQKADGDIA